MKKSNRLLDNCFQSKINIKSDLRNHTRECDRRFYALARDFMGANLNVLTTVISAGPRNASIRKNANSAKIETAPRGQSKRFLNN